MWFHVTNFNTVNFLNVLFMCYVKNKLSKRKKKCNKITQKIPLISSRKYITAFIKYLVNVFHIKIWRKLNKKY